jgi:hypothetical protein
MDILESFVCFWLEDGQEKGREKLAAIRVYMATKLKSNQIHHNRSKSRREYFLKTNLAFLDFFTNPGKKPA